MTMLILAGLCFVVGVGLFVSSWFSKKLRMLIVLSMISFVLMSVCVLFISFIPRIVGWGALIVFTLFLLRSIIMLFQAKKY